MKIMTLQRIILLALLAVFGCDVSSTDDEKSRDASEVDLVEDKIELIERTVFKGGEENYLSLSNLIEDISSIDSDCARYANFRKLIDVAMQCDFGKLDYKDKENVEKHHEHSRIIGLACANLRLVSEEVFARLWADEAPPEEQMYPLLMLIRKIRIEGSRSDLGALHYKSCVGVVERLFMRSIREGRFKSKREIAVAEEMFFQAVGRRICEGKRPAEK